MKMSVAVASLSLLIAPDSTLMVGGELMDKAHKTGQLSKDLASGSKTLVRVFQVAAVLGTLIWLAELVGLFKAG